MKELKDTIVEGLLDMSDDDAMDNKTDKLTGKNGDLRIFLSNVENAEKGFDRDFLGNKLKPGDFIVFTPISRMSSMASQWQFGQIVNVARILLVQTKEGRVSVRSDSSLKVTKDMIINKY